MSVSKSGAQIHNIDSLRKVLQSQHEDTSRVKTLNILSRQLALNHDFAGSIQMANDAIALSQRLHYKRRIVIGTIEQKGNEEFGLELKMITCIQIKPFIF
jgi:hypothetical protein